MSKKSKYTGTLAKPIDRFSLKWEPDEADKEPHDKLGKAYGEELFNRLDLLIKHYEIETNQPLEQVFLALALKLAHDHVPGFQITTPKRRGAKRKWTLDECRALVAAVDAQNTNKGLKVAIRMAMKRKDWKWGTNIASIEVRYYEAMRQIKCDEFVRNHPFSFEALAAHGEMYKRRMKRTTKIPS